MPTQRSPRSRHSYREPIREAILIRISRGEPLHVRRILEDAGGGSATTVQEELTALTGSPVSRKSNLVGRGAATLHARVVALENAIDEGLFREERLRAQVSVLQEELGDSRNNLDMVLNRYDHTHRQLLQAIDDLRQFARSFQSRSVVPPDSPLERPQVLGGDDRDALVKRCNSLAASLFELEEKNRVLKSTLHEHGIDL